MHIAIQVAWQIVDGEAIIVDLASGKTIGLNPTATFLWSRLEEQDEQNLTRSLAGAFNIDWETAAADVRAFLETMRKRGLVSES
jgi:hypothetical protein